jgi:hypothetical protein
VFLVVTYGSFSSPLSESEYDSIPSMTVEEFWEDGDKDYNKFKYGKPLGYYLVCVCGLQFIGNRIPEAVFKSQSFDLNI